MLHHEVKQIIKDGPIIEGSLTVSSITCPEDNREIIGTSIILRDITEKNYKKTVPGTVFYVIMILFEYLLLSLPYATL